MITPRQHNKQGQHNFFKDLANGEEIVLKEYGYTKDIVKSVLEVYNRFYSQCSPFASYFVGTDIKDTCNNIIDFVLANITYKLDPEGEQWIKTPYRFLADQNGDCKSYSLFVCSVLTCLGIKNAFRFASYAKDGVFTHVYSIAYDERGNELILDCVAVQQGKADKFQEIRYTKMKNIQNATKISMLSGVGDATDNNDILRGLTFSKSDSVATILAKSFLYRSEKENQKYWDFLIWILETYKSKEDLTICSYVFSTYCYPLFDGGYSNVDLSTMKHYCKEYVNGKNNTNSPYQISSISVKEGAKKWFDTNIMPNYNKVFNVDVTATVKTIVENSFNSLYLFADVKNLNDTQKTKRENEKLYFNAIIANTGVTFEACLNFCFGGCCYLYGYTPQALLKAMFFNEFKKVNSKIEGVKLVDDTEAKTTADVTKKDKSNLLDNITKIAQSASDIFTNIWKTVSGSNVKGNNYVTPSISDYEDSSVLTYLAGGALLLFGFLAVTKKGKKKRK